MHMDVICTMMMISYVLPQSREAKIMCRQVTVSDTAAPPRQRYEEVGARSSAMSARCRCDLSVSVLG